MNKEDHGDLAADLSAQKVAYSHDLYVQQFKQLAEALIKLTDFYALKGDTFDEAMHRVLYLKQVIENNDGYRIFYINGQPMRREKDLHILYKLTWFTTSIMVVDRSTSKLHVERVIRRSSSLSSPATQESRAAWTNTRARSQFTRRRIKLRNQSR